MDKRSNYGYMCGYHWDRPTSKVGLSNQGGKLIIRDGNWWPLDRPGYFGKRRQQKHAQFDKQFGRGNWRLGWKWGDLYLEPAEVVLLYEDAYLAFLVANPAVVREVTSFADVYDDAPSNVDSGLDYTAQETERTHLQDIAIRRCLLRLGCWFTGSGLLQIRDHEGEHPLSMTLSPGQVLFHKPELIARPQLAGWWQPGSVESFYQSNKTLLVRQA